MSYYWLRSRHAIRLSYELGDHIQLRTGEIVVVLDYDDEDHTFVGGLRHEDPNARWYCYEDVIVSS